MLDVAIESPLAFVNFVFALKLSRSGFHERLLIICAGLSSLLGVPAAVGARESNRSDPVSDIKQQAIITGACSECVFLSSCDPLHSNVTYSLGCDSGASFLPGSWQLRLYYDSTITT